MRVAGFNEQQRTWSQGSFSSIDDGEADARDDEQPLIAAAMAIVRAAFGIAGGKGHLGGLRAAVAEHDAETFAEAEGFALHDDFLTLNI